MMDLWVKSSQGEEILGLRRRLLQQLGDDARDFPDLASGKTMDADLEAAARRWQAGVGLVADGVVGPRCQIVLGLRESVALAVPLQPLAVRQLFPATKPANIDRYMPYVAAALQACGLTDRTMVCAALGTIRAESEGFLPIAEMPSQFNTVPGQAPFGAYDGRKSLGNTQPGDGARFKGRGFVQLTGRDNYARYGRLLGVDLVANPDLANAPEVAAVLLARFLADRAEAFRSAIAEGRFAAARKLVNGGSHGLERFRDVFQRADAVWPVTAPVGRAGVGRPRGGRRAPQPAAGASAPGTAHATADAARETASGEAGTASAARPVRGRSLTVRPDAADLRDRLYTPPPVGLVHAYPDEKDLPHFLPRYTRAGLILDQGQEGACTGFGLACVVNYLRWRQDGAPAKFDSVSPRMLYNFARRYDEYEGEDYDGSSCRGALKGWFNHGVCMESDWPYADGAQQPRYGYAQRARATTVGVYYRIDCKCITDMQAAIQHVGAVYVSAFTHAGWDQVARRAKAPRRHDELPRIAFDGRPSEVDGHAFALVGFNTRGFVVQNSWGAGWGAGGFAELSYADWLANGMDAWVVAMGVPGVLEGRLRNGTAAGSGAASGADKSLWWSEDQAYQHSLVFGNDGRMKRYLTQDELSRTLLHQVADLPDQWFRSQPAGQPKRLVVYAHGGLNSEEAAIRRARAMGRHFIGNGCYPLFLVWKTGLLESITGIVADAFRRQPALAGGMGEWMAERSDLLLEKAVGRPLAKPLWSEMKENAELAFGAGRGGDLLLTALQKLAATWGEALEIHLVGHSAGSIILGHMLSAAAARGLQERLASIHLYAPACTVQFANRHYAPQTALMQRLHLHVLSDRVERNDTVGAVYRKSLLYFVSNALEADLRTPILGLENVFQADYAGWDGSSSTGETLRTWRDAVAAAGLRQAGGIRVLDQDKVVTALPDRRIDAAHGSFDNDLAALGDTLLRIIDGPLARPVDDLRGF